jgi:tetratricopeptide (TPR) repeat protein
MQWLTGFSKYHKLIFLFLLVDLLLIWPVYLYPKPTKEQEPADKMFSLGASSLSSGHFEEAISFFQKSIQLRPRFFAAHVYLGLAYSRAGRHLEAIQSYNQAIRIKSDFFFPYLGLGQSYYKTGNFSEAIEAYKRAIQYKPDLALAHYGIASVYAHVERYQEAIEAYKRAIQYEPDFAVAHCGLASVYVALERYQEAIERYQEAIHLNPKYVEAIVGLGIVYERLGRYKEAVEKHRQAIQINPNYADAYYNLGVTYLCLGQHKEAAEAFRKAINIDEEFAEAHTGLGVAYEKLGNYREAIEQHKRAVEIKPGLALAHYNLGVAYLKAKEKNAAIGEYRLLQGIDQHLAEKLFEMISSPPVEERRETDILLGAVINGMKVLLHWQTYAIAIVYFVISFLPVIADMLATTSDSYLRMTKGSLLAMLVQPFFQSLGVFISVCTLSPIILFGQSEAAWSLPWWLIVNVPGRILILLVVMLGASLAGALLPVIGRANSFIMLIMGCAVFSFLTKIGHQINPELNITGVQILPGFTTAVGILIISGFTTWLGIVGSALAVTLLLGEKNRIGELIMIPLGTCFGFIPIFIYGAWLGLQIQR